MTFLRFACDILLRKNLKNLKISKSLNVTSYQFLFLKKIKNKVLNFFFQLEMIKQKIHPKPFFFCLVTIATNFFGNHDNRFFPQTQKQAASSFSKQEEDPKRLFMIKSHLPLTD